MKNLKFDKKRLTALLLAGNMLLFSGCGKSEEEEECKVITSYNLPKTLVVTRSDDTVDIAKKIYINESSFALEYEHKDHDHYKSLITGEIYSTNECDIDKAAYTICPAVSAGTMAHYSQLNSKSVSYYLTDEELIKIKNGEFTRNDEDNVLKRILESNVKVDHVTESEPLESVEEATESEPLEPVEETTKNVTDTTDKEVVEINANVKTYDLKELYVSETSSPFNDSTIPYIFWQMDYDPEYYREYHGEFFTVDKNSYSASYAYENNFQDWNPEFVISDSIVPLSMYLTEEEMKSSEAGQLTELQLDGILDRIRSEYKQQLSEKGYSKSLTDN